MSKQTDRKHQAAQLQRVPLTELKVEITEAEILADLLWPEQRI